MRDKQWHFAQEASLRQTALRQQPVVRQQEPAQSSPETRSVASVLRVSAEKQRRLSDSFEVPSDALSDDIESIESQECSSTCCQQPCFQICG